MTDVRVGEPLEIRAYDHATDEARRIRLAAFTELAHARPEFDDRDESGSGTVHLLGFLDGAAVATCRYYADPDHPDQPGRYVIARLAVVPGLQGRGLGTRMLAEAESRIRALGGRIAAVHAARKRFGYYERLGYEPTADMYDGGHHGWLVRNLARDLTQAPGKDTPCSDRS
ncbi:GNAT family acetyltransferase [Bifidobacterium sp. DSM 109958]|uniref:GNAT family acetyltransferase n=2 Tax=Bifidobacterium moraviense TaxID=2675323 RepID=A0A7Y0HWQ9_9BIFI|nr:GNAT family acetyltransferase [Bifidobacterium sp. DSM 109958]